MKTSEEERRWVIPDYSKPAYYFRLFHEGGPFRDPPTQTALDAASVGLSEKEFLHQARTRYVFSEWFVEQRRAKEKLSDSIGFNTSTVITGRWPMRKEPVTTGTSPVDPLDGVW